MKLRKIAQVEDFLKAANNCTGDVYLTSQYGDKYNLKSALAQYVAIAALLGEHGDDLELWCDKREDEANFFLFFKENPEVNGLEL